MIQQKVVKLPNERQEKDFVAYPKPTTFEEQMQEVERYVSGEGECQLSELPSRYADYCPI